MEQLKVSLIDVGSPRKEMNEPVGIETIAGHARAYVPEVDITLGSIQLNVSEEIASAMLRDKDVVGISTKLNSLERTNNLIRRIRDETSRDGGDPLIVLGDLYPTFAPEKMLEYHPDTICVVGEGEMAFVGILEAIRHVRGRIQDVREILMEKGVPNLVFRHGDQVVNTPRRLVDLNTSVLQSRDLAQDVIKAGGIIRTDASRGCPWGRCKFCGVTSKYGQIGWRPFPIEKVIDELTAISNTGAKSPYFNDEDFIGSDPNRAMELARRIIAAKKGGRIAADLNYFVSMRVNSILGEGIGSEQEVEDMMLLLKKSGLREVFLGVESGTKSQMKRFAKNATSEKNVRAIQTLRRLGIDLDIGFIMFDPKMNLADIAHNVGFAYKAGINNHDARLVKKLRVQPRTGLEAEYVRDGIVSPTLDVNTLTYPYDFQNKDVQRVYDDFRNWEDSASDFVYDIQTQSRGEVESEEYRTLCKKILGRFRELDLAFLKDLVENGQVDEKKFQSERNALINEAKSKIKC